MPRTRILFPAIVATVLAVGALWAFRGGVLWNGETTTPTRTLGTKARMRPGMEEGKSRALRWEGSETATRQEKIEGFLRKNGRTGATLGAALLLAREEDNDAYARYAEELRGMKDDPVAMAFAVSVLHDEACVQRAMELEPDNIIPAVRGSCTGVDVDVKLFIQAMSRSTWRDHIKESEDICLNAALYVLGDERESWKMSVYRLNSVASSMAVDPFADASSLFPQVPDADKEVVDRDLALAMRKYAEMGKDGDVLTVPIYWNGYLSHRFSEEELQRYLGIDKEQLEIEARQSSLQSLNFTDAVDHATPEQIAELEKSRHEIGLRAAKKRFYAQWQEQEAERKKLEELE